MEEWFIRHLDRDENIIDELKVPELTFTLRHKEPGDIAYDVALSEPTMRWAFAGPKRTTYELWNSDYPDRPITSGIHSYINTKRGEEVLHVQGKTWLWYWQNRHYPFNPQAPNAFLGGTAANDQGLAYQKFADPVTIIGDLWDKIAARPNGNPYNMSFIDLIPIGVDVGYRVELADTRTMYDFINELSEVDPGFDFYDNVAKEIVTVSPALYPEIARTDPAYCIHTFDRFTPPTDVIDIEFENSGPTGTHILGLGAGTATRIGRAYGYDQSQDVFGRWDMIEDYPEILSTNRLIARTQAAFSKGLYPQHNIPMEIKPDSISGFWTLFTPGHAIWIRENFESNHVDGANSITEMRAIINTQGETRVQFGLEEINKTGRPGTVQG